MHCHVAGGGQGSRLGLLTKTVAKPAVPFGGKYRIIDFPLSNCSNSGIDVVGVLTQYQPLELNSYIGSGQSWDLDLLNGGRFRAGRLICAAAGGNGIAARPMRLPEHSLYDKYDPDYVLILSGDQLTRWLQQNARRAHQKRSGSHRARASRGVGRRAELWHHEHG